MAKGTRDVELDKELEEDLEGLDEDALLIDDEEEENVEVDEVEDEEEDEDEEDLDDDELLRVVEEEDSTVDESYFEEEAGYREDFDWSTLGEADRQRHDDLLNASKEALEAVSFKRLSVFDRWAAAQAFAKNNMREAFLEACQSILKERRKHEALLYEDIYLELISELADAKRFEEAFAFLERFRKSYPEEEDIYQRVKGLLLIESGEIHEGKSILDNLMLKANDHGDLHLEIGDDLLAMGHPELSLRILDKGKDFARRHRDTELMTALDETRRLAMKRIEEDL